MLLVKAFVCIYVVNAQNILSILASSVDENAIVIAAACAHILRSELKFEAFTYIIQYVTLTISMEKMWGMYTCSLLSLLCLNLAQSDHFSKFMIFCSTLNFGFTSISQPHSFVTLSFCIFN